jgi:hypothetical protein
LSDALELVIGNTVRRILFIVRDEFVQKEVEDRRLEETLQRESEHERKSNPQVAADKARRGMPNMCWLSS